MMSVSPKNRWGLVATIKADARDILEFAAHHIEAGAHRLYLYLDAPCPEAMPFLDAHQKIRALVCDDTYWLKRGKSRPAKHQVRQTKNATRAYRNQAKDVDWLIHMDVDEFLWCENSVQSNLADLSADVFCARTRPVESLGGADTVFKARIPRTPERAAIAQRLYPQYGEHFSSGLLSHEQGKIFVRTGADGVKFRIHNVFVDDVTNPSQVELPQVDLCHFHGKDWDSWISHYRYRLHKGSYRAELKPDRSSDEGGITLHELLTTIEAQKGETGLRAFYDEVCADSPERRAVLQSEGLLKNHELNLAEKRQKQFPGFG